MAKENKNVEVVEVASETNEVAVKEVETKELKVKGLENHVCSIAKVTYIIEQGKETKLPVGVAMILAGSQKIMILG